MEKNGKEVDRRKFFVITRDRIGNGIEREGRMTLVPNDKYPELYKPTKKKRDRGDVTIIKKMFERIGQVDDISTAKPKTPDLKLHYKEYTILIECKHIETNNIEKHICGAFQQIEDYGGPRALGIICLIFTIDKYCPFYYSDVYPEYTIKFQRIAQPHLSNKPRMILVFPCLLEGNSPCYYMDSVKAQCFYFEPHDIDVWLKRLSEQNCQFSPSIPNKE